jgi:hypothetical protein
MSSTVIILISIFLLRGRKTPTRLDQGFKRKERGKILFKVKAPHVKELQFQQDATKPWEYSADIYEDLRAWIMTCENYFQYNAWQ